MGSGILIGRGYMAQIPFTWRERRKERDEDLWPSHVFDVVNAGIDREVFEILAINQHAVITFQSRVIDGQVDYI